MKKVILVLLIIILTVLFPVKLQPSRTYPVLQKNVRYILVKRVPILKSKMVKATAYNAVQRQTDRTPTICAWGDRIHPGVIAISRDLEKIFTRNTKIFVHLKTGVEQKIVKDRMHRRKKNQIDIFLPEYRTARKFGRQWIKISWIESYLLVFKKIETLKLGTEQQVIESNQLLYIKRKDIDRNPKLISLIEDNLCN
jgi:3D (Asp-Asp-Asp) domain-containing protein